MPYANDFYSMKEKAKPAAKRMYHNNSECGPGKEVPEYERMFGNGGYRLCKDCAKLNSDGR